MAEEPGRAVPDGAPADPRIGKILQERYRIIRRIAAGGMGIVYQAERVGLGRIVAIKFLHASMARDPQIQMRFEIEAQAMSRLCHPNCIGVLDFGLDDLPYVVIDYVEGAPLDVVLERGRLPPRRAVKIVRQILAALAHAHAHGIVHRDIKPENVVLEGTPGLEDHVRILDFGLAKLMGSDFGLTVGVAVGTPNYMAPEQMSEGPVDGRADLYATGIVLFELLTGRKPFEAEELGEIFLKHLGTPPPKLRQVAPDRNFSAALEAVILRAMAKRPAERFASAEAMGAALDDVPEAYATPGPESVLGEMGQAPGRSGSGAPKFPHAPASSEHVSDATVPWSSSRLSLPIDSKTTGPAPFSDLGRSGPAWRRWLSERPFRLAVASGLGSALLAGAMVTIGFSGRPVHEDQVAAAAAPPPPVPARRTGLGPVTRAPVRPSPSEKNAAVVSPRVPSAPPKPPVAARTVSPPRPTGAAKPAPSVSAAPAPRTASEAAAAGQKAFAQGNYSAGLESFRTAIRRDPRRRSDPALLGPVITSLDGDKRGERAAFLREIGDPALPQLRMAAKSHPNPKVRAKAAELLPPTPAAAPKRKPFLRWL